MVSDRLTGSIGKYFPERGFGFIYSPSYKDQLYFHFTFIEGGEESKLYELLNSLTEYNIPVTFAVKTNLGRLQATNIRLYDAGVEESPITQIEDFLRSSRSTQENAIDEFWNMTSFAKIPFIEKEPDLRKLAILKITKSTPIWEAIVDLAERWIALEKVISKKQANEEAQNIVEDFYSALTSVLKLQTLNEAEYIDAFSATQVKLVKPFSPIRWLRQAEDSFLITFANARALRQCIQKDPTFVESSSKLIKLAVLLDEDEISSNETMNFSSSRIALVRRKEIIQTISSPRTDNKVALGRILRSFLPHHLMQPFEVGSEYNRAVFSGRGKNREQILDNISGNYAIYGGRKIGKSWLLKDLYYHCQNSQYNEIYVPVYVSVQGAESIEDAIDRISDKLLETFHIPSSESVSSSKRLLYYLRKTHEITNRRILLALDEVDDLFKMNGWFDFFGSLRAFQQNNPGAIKFVFAGFKELMRKLLYERDNFAFANLFGKNHFSLSCLDKEDLERLIVEPLKWVGLEFDENEIVNTIYGLTSGHPYYTQAICQVVVEDRLKQDSIILSSRVIEKLASLEFFSEVSDIFEDNLSNLQKLIGKICSVEQRVYSEKEIQEALFNRFDINIDDKQVKEELRILVACSVFTRSESGYEPLMPQINQKYFGGKDDTTLALAYLEGKR